MMIEGTTANLLKTTCDYGANFNKCSSLEKVLMIRGGMQVMPRPAGFD